jgi:uncharacterized membrane protein YkoI
MRKKLIAAGAGLAAMAAATGVAFAGGHGTTAGTSQAAWSSAPASRLDDGKDLLPQARISEQDAIAAAQRSASGALNEVDLEHYQDQLVYNVDVGAKDVKVDATTGDVLAAPQDD